MDTDIQFGALEETQPETHLRPDRNKQFTVAAYGTPHDGDVQIFVDLDVMRDMESHAREDTNVELGGVLLGGQFVDEDGKSFVMVTDSLRAEHYEATRGSFKFTHETWEQITRQREQFPDELQMVGWYHTHPDWGVFLSGMDMFICDHFFNRPLDLALVIDPCRGDRGMFQWTGNPTHRIRRTGGFYLMTSRFRQAELEWFASVLEESHIMGNDPRLIAGQIGPSPAPIVNVHGGHPPWLSMAVLGMLTMQFVLLFLIAWKFVTAPVPSEIEQLAALEAKVENLTTAPPESDLSRELLRGIVSQLNGGEQFVERLKQLEIDTRLAKVQALERVALREKQSSEIASLTKELKLAEASLERERRRHAETADALADAHLEVANYEKRLEELTGDSDETAASGLPTYNLWSWIAIGAGVIAVLVIVGFGAAFVMRQHDGEDLDFSGEERLEEPRSGE